MLDMNDPGQARIVERLQHEEYAYFITVRPDGRPHAVPVCFLWEDNSILIFSIPESIKVRNLRQNPHVALALDSFGDNDYFSVIVEGRAELVDEPGLDMTYPAYAVKHAALSERLFGTSTPPVQFIRTYAQVIRLTPTRIRHDE